MEKTIKKERLRIQDLKDFPPNKIFSGGMAYLMLPEGIGLSRWIAIKSGASNWTIFYGYGNQTEMEIAEKRWRLTDPYEVQKLVLCTPGAFEKYRYY